VFIVFNTEIFRDISGRPKILGKMTQM